MSTTGYSKSQNWYSRFILKPLGLNEENDLVLWLLLLFGGLLLLSFWYSQGDIWVAFSSVLLMSMLVLTILRVDYSLYVLLLGVILFEQFHVQGFDFLISHDAYFRSATNIPFFSYLPVEILSLFELHFLLICVSMLLMHLLNVGSRWRSIPAARSYTIFLVIIFAAVVYGIQKSGSVYAVFVESRALFYFMLLYIAVPQIIQTKRQIRTFFWILITAVSIKTLFVVYWYNRSGYMQGDSNMLFGSENTLFILTLVVLGLSFIVVRVKDYQKWFLIALMPLLVIGYYAVAATAAYIALAVTVGVFCFLIPAAALKKMILLVSTFLIAVILYSALFTGNKSGGGLVNGQAKLESAWTKVKQTFADVDTKLYEEAKQYKVSEVLVENPFVGTGFGYAAEYKVASTNVLTVREKIPHNQILWLLLKVGILGLLAFIVLFLTYLTKAFKLLSRVIDTYLAIVLRVIVIVVVYQLIMLFFEPQLVYYRSMIFLGCLMGMFPAISQITFEQTESVNKSKIEKSRLEERAVSSKISRVFN